MAKTKSKNGVKVSKKKGSASKKPQHVHIVLRIKAEDGMTVRAHRKVIEESGSVMFAKIGKGLGDNFSSQLNDQLEAGIPTFLFLAAHQGWKKPYGFYKCELRRVSSKLSSDQRKLVPSYIRKSIPAISTWLEITTLLRLSDQESNRIIVLSSGREIKSAIRGTTSVFRVGVKGTEEMETVADSDSPQSARSKDADLAEIDLDQSLNDDKEFVENWYDFRDL